VKCCLTTFPNKNYQWSVGLAVKTSLYLCKDENTSSISKKRIYWEKQSPTLNRTNLILSKGCENIQIKKKLNRRNHTSHVQNRCPKKTIQVKRWVQFSWCWRCRFQAWLIANYIQSVINYSILKDITILLCKFILLFFTNDNKNK